MPKTTNDIGHNFIETVKTNVKIKNNPIKVVAKKLNMSFWLTIPIDKKLIPINPRKTGHKVLRECQEVKFK
ncbi:MAG: hypothetical protein ONB42_02590 [candidate division KSB1 bacterium]|nr:hypothetical protein [candidate division KSB1 bacterium]